MNSSRWFLITLLILPVLIAVFDIGLVGAVILVMVWLLARWMITLRDLVRPQESGLHLDTIAASHFVEKVRWCLDRANIPYTEHQNVGSMGAFFTGRSVPRLRARTGQVTSSIGNSPEILRYLWGNYGHEDTELRSFLEPTADRIAMEHTLERYGRNLQVWVYYYLLEVPDTLGKAWGLKDPNTPAFQRAIAHVIAPVLRRLIRLSFNITPETVKKARHYIEQLLATTEARLAESNFLVGDRRSYVDYTFAALSGLWLQPEQFGNGKADGVRLEPAEYPQGIRDDIARWREQYPATVSFLEHLYQNERSGVAQTSV